MLPNIRGLSEKCLESRILDMLPMLLSGRLLAALRFQVTLKQDGCASGHVACSDSRQDHHRAVGASLWPPRDWRRRRGHLHTPWLRGIDADVQSANIGIHSLWRKANDHVLWRLNHRHGNTPLGARHWRRRRDTGEIPVGVTLNGGARCTWCGKSVRLLTT